MSSVALSCRLQLLRPAGGLTKEGGIDLPIKDRGRIPRGCDAAWPAHRRDIGPERTESFCRLRESATSSYRSMQETRHGWTGRHAGFQHVLSATPVAQTRESCIFVLAETAHRQRFRGRTCRRQSPVFRA